MKMVDTNGDGEIDFQEFMQMMRTPTIHNITVLIFVAVRECKFTKFTNSPTTTHNTQSSLPKSMSTSGWGAEASHAGVLKGFSEKSCPSELLSPPMQTVRVAIFIFLLS